MIIFIHLIEKSLHLIQLNSNISVRGKKLSLGLKDVGKCATRIQISFVEFITKNVRDDETNLKHFIE